MSLENATYISQLIPTNPTINDFVSQGDDHFRMFKKAVQNTFPNYDKAVMVGPDVLNQVPANLTAIIVALAANTLKKGAIVAHDLANAPIPAGWSLCDGSNIANYGTAPDLRDKFILGSLANQQGAVGGSLAAFDSGDAGAHSHSTTSGAHTLTVDEMPAHVHRLKGSFTQGEYGGGSNDFYRIRAANNLSDDGAMEATGGGQAHSHPDGTTNSATDHHHSVTPVLPPYYRSVFIVKTSDFVMPT